MILKIIEHFMHGFSFCITTNFIVRCFMKRSQNLKIKVNRYLSIKKTLFTDLLSFKFVILFIKDISQPYIIRVLPFWQNLNAFMLIFLEGMHLSFTFKLNKHACTTFINIITVSYCYYCRYHQDWYMCLNKSTRDAIISMFIYFYYIDNYANYAFNFIHWDK